MMRFPQTLRSRAKAFREDETGNASIELAFMVPLLAVITFGLITFFTAFKAKTQATRAATVVADMVSRETNPITPTYLDGVSDLMDTLIETDATPEYRLTAFLWNDRRGEYRVRWSKHDSSHGTHNHASLNAVADRLPELKHGQRAILVETWVDYDPLHSAGMEEVTTFENFLIAAPRFVPQLCWLSDESNPTINPKC
ncbi:MAG: TadE/TadG family type IV pilus assembly protein [Pseudomonadota bacterium]